MLEDFIPDSEMAHASSSPEQKESLTRPAPAGENAGRRHFLLDKRPDLS
jgi:hypothetical protein